MPYVIADLEKLVAERAFAEALDHAGDIAPTARDVKWEVVTAAAAAGVLAATPNDDGASLAVIDAIDHRYPQLVKVAAYATPRAERGKTGLVACFKGAYDGDACMAAGTRFVDASKDPAITLAVAKIVRTSWSSAGAVTLFERVATPTVCKDADLSLSVVAALDLAPETPVAVAGRAVMATCWDSVRDAVVKTFGEATKGSNVYKNTCDTLKAKGLLSPLQTKRCTK